MVHPRLASSLQFLVQTFPRRTPMTSRCQPMLLSPNTFQPVPALPRQFHDPHFAAFLVRRSPQRQPRAGSGWRLDRLLGALALLLLAVVFGVRPVA